MTPPILEYRLDALTDPEAPRVVPTIGREPASARNFLEALVRDSGSRSGLTYALAHGPFGAYAWECRPLRPTDLDAPMEMVIVESPALATRAADPRPFREPLAASRDEIVVFENLGRDATLVVPRPVGPASAYPHLGRFLREAPPGQVDALWRRSAQAVLERIGQRQAPLWLSTAGLGVSWLHVRLDDRPKYYRHAPFRRG